MNLHPVRHETTVFLSAPVNALVEGIYEESTPFSEVKHHGDFGLGTFNDLDGEMVMLEGQIFQIDSTGRVNRIADTALTPFACVTHYKPISHDALDGELTYPDFLKWLMGLFPSENLFYAVRMDGTFAHVKTRSVPKQENYRPLVEVAKEQPTFEFHDIEGTLAGFYTPQFLSSLSVPGIHLHFLSKDQQHGGHLLECRPRQLRIGVQFIRHLELAMPLSVDYLTWDFSRDVNADLNKAEK